MNKFVDFCKTIKWIKHSKPFFKQFCLVICISLAFANIFQNIIFKGCLIIFQVDALQCRDGIGISPNSGSLTMCEPDEIYCEVKLIKILTYYNHNLIIIQELFCSNCIRKCLCQFLCSCQWNSWCFFNWYSMPTND